MTTRLHPRHAVSYFRNPSRANATPAILWLVIALVGIIAIRNRALPSLSQSITLALFAGLVVAAGLVLPELVTLLLVALLVGAVLNVPQLVPILNAVNARVAGLISAGQ
jgi:hypothetical protein